MLESLEKILEGQTDPEQRLRLFVENHLRFFVNNMKEMKVLSHEATALTGEARSRVNSLKRRYTEFCQDLLRAIRPEETADRMRVRTFALFGMMNWIYNWYRPGRDLRVEDLAAEMTRLFLHGYMQETAPLAVPDRGAGPLKPIWPG